MKHSAKLEALLKSARSSTEQRTHPMLLSEQDARRVIQSIVQSVIHNTAQNTARNTARNTGGERATHATHSSTLFWCLTGAVALCVAVVGVSIIAYQRMASPVPQQSQATPTAQTVTIVQPPQLVRVQSHAARTNSLSLEHQPALSPLRPASPHLSRSSRRAAQAGDMARTQQETNTQESAFFTTSVTTFDPTAGHHRYMMHSLAGEPGFNLEETISDEEKVTLRLCSAMPPFVTACDQF